MEFILELLARAIFEYLLGWPGATIRWFYFKMTKKEKSFKKILNNGIEVNVILTCLLLAIVGIIFNYK